MLIPDFGGRTVSCSVVIPRIKLIHFAGWRRVGESRWGDYKWLAHYDCRKNYLGRTLRNSLREPNHYDRTGRLTGYSRTVTMGAVVHFDRHGKRIGYSRCFCGLLWTHHKLGAPTKQKGSAAKRKFRSRPQAFKKGA